MEMASGWVAISLTLRRFIDLYQVKQKRSALAQGIEVLRNVKLAG